MVKLCVQSIINQLYRDFNFFVLDNSSTDGTVEWIASLGDNRVTIIPSDKSLSMTDNWSRIARLKKADYFTIIGHDDLLYKNYLSEMDKLLTSKPGFDIYQAHFGFIDGQGKQVRKCLPMQSFYKPADFMKAILNRSLDTMGTGYMIRSSVYDDFGGIPPYPNLLFADHALWISMAAEKGIAVSSEELFCFRVHQSISTTTQVPAYIKAFFMFLDFLKETRLKNDEFKEVLNETSADFIGFYCTSLTHRLLKANPKLREGVMVDDFINTCVSYSRELSDKHFFNPHRVSSLRMARLIDKSSILRSLYLLFRSAYSKPIHP